MRLLFPSFIGMLLFGCGLSMNPDLPSAEDGGDPLFGGNDDQDIGWGDGDAGPEINEPPGLTPDASGLGGASHCSPEDGGAGGKAPPCGGGTL